MRALWIDPFEREIIEENLPEFSAGIRDHLGGPLVLELSWIEAYATAFRYSPGLQPPR